MVIFHCYVSLPEGKSYEINIFHGLGPPVKVNDENITKIFPVADGHIPIYCTYIHIYIYIIYHISYILSLVSYYTWLPLNFSKHPMVSCTFFWKKNRFAIVTVPI